MTACSWSHHSRRESAEAFDADCQVLRKQTVFFQLLFKSGVLAPQTIDFSAVVALLAIFSPVSNQLTSLTNQMVAGEQSTVAKRVTTNAQTSTSGFFVGSV